MCVHMDESQDSVAQIQVIIQVGHSAIMSTILRCHKVGVVCLSMSITRCSKRRNKLVERLDVQMDACVRMSDGAVVEVAGIALRGDFAILLPDLRQRRNAKLAVQDGC
uniref:Uncharacterized protein n=1 Tax=Craspedostauros australis TaxID=1486917 RepID=A0A7R9WQM5_9STRA